MESLGTREELEARLSALEQKRSSLESEISVLVNQIPILEMSRHATVLESSNNSLSLVRDMLLTLVDAKPALEREATSTVTTS
jgi:hypothetical protein